MTAKAYPNDSLLVTPDALHAELGSPDLVLIDARPAELYAAGHLPGAAHLDLYGMSLVDTRPDPLRAFLWMIAHLLAARGVDAERKVVFYETDSGMRAARGFWFLEHFGHAEAHLLDGGVKAWTAAGHALTTEARPPETTAWTGGRVPENLATVDGVRERLGNPGVRIVDSRSEAEYQGTQARAARGGAIPGAVHLEWTRNLTPAGDFKPPAALRALYEDAGVLPEHEVVAYCQGGYRSAHTYLALRLLGYPRVRNYLGSWKEWGDRDDLPIKHPGRP
jgi:thiosulfate/3-mercaptopyruvate sulfurtransferase